jgi:hypothetical protein
MITKIVDELKNDGREIDRLRVKTKTLQNVESNMVLRQIAQQISFFPSFLSQQIKHIIELEKQFGEEFQNNCHEEVREIAETACDVRKSIEKLFEIENSEPNDAQIQCAQSLMNGMSRLNRLQQRIAGKMMKISKLSG